MTRSKTFGENAPPIGAISPKFDLLTLTFLTLVVRLALMPFNESFYGDAVARTELAQRWLASPHWIASASQGAEQFGPLHIYGVAALLALGVPAADAGRWLSLLVGTATAIPLLLLARRLFGKEAAITSGLLFAFWGFHLQLSTTGASEALGLFWVLSACAALASATERQQGGWGALVLSGFCATLTCAVRYDLWLLLPWMGAVCFWRRGFGMASAWAACAALFPALWLAGNAWVDGTPLGPIESVEAFHRAWVIEEQGRYVAFWGPLGNAIYTAVQLLFWPAIALITLGPWTAWAMARGLVGSWRERPAARWCLAVIALPALYFSFRAVLLQNFVPLARFTVVQLALALPFAGWVLRERRARAWALLGTATLAVVTGAFALPVFPGMLGKVSELLRPVSPISRNPPGILDAARFLRAERAAGGSVLLDSDPAYWDIQVGFFSGWEPSRLIRLRQQLEGRGPISASADWLVRLPRGALGSSIGREASGGRLLVGTRSYRQWATLRDGVTIYHASP